MKAAGKWLLRGLVVGSAVAAFCGLAYWYRYDAESVLALVCVLWMLLGIPVALCGCLYWVGRRRIGSGRRGGRAMVGAALTGGALAVAVFGCYLWVAGPWFNRIILRGTAPDGGEYILSQAWNDWFDGYDIRLFHRQPDGQWLSLWGGYNWESYYRGYEIEWSGHAPVIRLADGSERGFNHRPDCNTTHPASLSPDDLHALHLAEMRANRSIPGIWHILNKADSEGGHPMTALLQLSLHSSCTGTRQDAASPEAERRLGGAASSRALVNGARLEGAPHKGGKAAGPESSPMAIAQHCATNCLVMRCAFLRNGGRRRMTA